MASYAALWAARIEMARPGNAAMAGLGTLVGLEVVRQGDLTVAMWTAAPIAAFLVAAFGNVLNDVSDEDLDRLAHPARPLPSGRIGRRDAQVFAALLLAFGLWEAFVAAGPPALGFAAANALLLVVYERLLKARGLAGNVLIALLVASTFAFGAVVAGAPVRAWGVLWLLMAMAALANLAREILKDIEDLEADRGQRRTLALSWGPGASR